MRTPTHCKHSKIGSFDHFANELPDGDPIPFERLAKRLPQGVPIPSFANASNITVLRHPVDRVWSYYAYGRQNGFKEFLDYPIDHFLEDPELAANVSTDCQGKCPAFGFHSTQLFNSMTRTLGFRVGEATSPTPLIEEE